MVSESTRAASAYYIGSGRRRMRGWRDGRGEWEDTHETESPPRQPPPRSHQWSERGHTDGPRFAALLMVGDHPPRGVYGSEERRPGTSELGRTRPPSPASLDAQAGTQRI